jgi:hypothetical protein
MTKPEWTKYVRVDELIECYPISKEVKRALLEAMPDAYGGESPGEDDFPEPDAKRDAPYKLAVCWDKLAEPIQAAVAAAYQQAVGRS